MKSSRRRTQLLLLLSLPLWGVLIQGVLSCDNKKNCNETFINSHTEIEMPCLAVCGIVDPKQKDPKATETCRFFCPDCASVLYPKAESPKTSTGKPKETTLITRIFKIPTQRPINNITQRLTDTPQMSKAKSHPTTTSKQDDVAMTPTGQQVIKSDETMHMIEDQKDDRKSELIDGFESMDTTVVIGTVATVLILLVFFTFLGGILGYFSHKRPKQ